MPNLTHRIKNAIRIICKLSVSFYNVRVSAIFMDLYHLYA